MKDYLKARGRGRTRVSLSVMRMGDGILVTIFNENAHIGAVAVADYDFTEKRASTSVITRLGHKDDALPPMAAGFITKETRHPSCVVAGVHLAEITPAEIQKVLENAEHLVKNFCALMPPRK